MDAAAVEAKHGVRPSQMGDLLALVGDASDNVPGIPGIGAKTAAQLIAAHGSLDAVLEGAARLTKPTKRSTTLVENAEVARRARRLVELNADAPLDHAVVEGGAPTFENLDGFKQFCARWELFSVMRNAEALATQANAQRLQGLKWGNAARVVGPSEAGQEAGVSHAAKEEEEEETAPMVTDPMVTDGGSPAQAMFEEHAVAAAPAAANGAATTAAIEPSVAGVAGDALQSAPGASDPGASAAEAAAEAAGWKPFRRSRRPRGSRASRRSRGTRPRRPPRRPRQRGRRPSPQTRPPRRPRPRRRRSARAALPLLLLPLLLHQRRAPRPHERFSGRQLHPHQPSRVQRGS